MELTILGSGTSAPSLTRGAPGHLLRVGRDRVVLDSGPGTLSRLLQAGVRHDDVTHILYSHTHLDHVAELPFWLFVSRIPSLARTRPLTILGSAGFMAMLAGLKEIHGPWLDAAGYTLRLVTLDGAARAPVQLDGWTVQPFPVRHTGSSVGFRIREEAGKVLACTGDTDVCADLADMARDADLLLIEASTPDGQKLPGHLTPSEAGDVARQAGARRVVLTHFYPACEGVDMLGQLRRTWDGEGILAQDGLRVSV